MGFLQVLLTILDETLEEEVGRRASSSSSPPSYLGEKKWKSRHEILEEDVGRVGFFQFFLTIFLTLALISRREEVEVPV